jgi:hypothetical protein
LKNKTKKIRFIIAALYLAAVLFNIIGAIIIQSNDYASEDDEGICYSHDIINPHIQWAKINLLKLKNIKFENLINQSIQINSHNIVKEIASPLAPISVCKSSPFVSNINTYDSKIIFKESSTLFHPPKIS